MNARQTCAKISETCIPKSSGGALFCQVGPGTYELSAGKCTLSSYEVSSEVT
jgi:hypothetical protein